MEFRNAYDVHLKVLISSIQVIGVQEQHNCGQMEMAFLTASIGTKNLTVIAISTPTYKYIYSTLLYLCLCVGRGGFR